MLPSAPANSNIPQATGGWLSNVFIASGAPTSMPSPHTTHGVAELAAATRAAASTALNVAYIVLKGFAVAGCFSKTHLFECEEQICELDWDLALESIFCQCDRPLAESIAPIPYQDWVT
jgi:hypothetical protein